MAASSGCQGELLLTLAVQERGEDWPAVAEALRPLAEQLRQRARSADECRALYQAICARGAADEPIGAAVDALRAQRAAELRVEAGALEARTERLRRQLAAVDAGERDDIPTLLAMLPPSLPLLSPAGAGADGAPPPSKAATAQLLKMLNAISKHKWAYPFKRPVTDKEAPDYKDIVKQPMVRARRPLTTGPPRAPARASPPAPRVRRRAGLLDDPSAHRVGPALRPRRAARRPLARLLERAPLQRKGLRLF